MPWYFAYGSNMNIERVAARIGETRRVLAGSLEGYALRFNKASRVPGIAASDGAGDDATGYSEWGCTAHGDTCRCGWHLYRDDH